jgi:hypothetical protein
LAGRTAAMPILGRLHHQYVCRLTKHIVRFYRLPPEVAEHVAAVEGSSLARTPESKKATLLISRCRSAGIDDLRRWPTMSQVGVRTRVILIRGRKRVMLAIERSNRFANKGLPLRQHVTTGFSRTAAKTILFPRAEAAGRREYFGGRVGIASRGNSPTLWRPYSKGISRSRECGLC